MRSKIIVITIIVFVCIAIAYAADVKWTALAELTTINDADVLCVVDDVAGTPTSKKITVVNLFDTIDTFAELNTIVADKTLVNEEDAAAWDALGTFNLGITITTGDPFTLGAVRWDNGSDKIDGEQIADNTIDVDSLDWGAFTDLGESGAVTWGNITAGELADDTVNDDDINWADLTYLTTNGAAIDEAFAAGWNADVGPPEKDDVYDILHAYDTDDDGDIDTVDSGIAALLYETELDDFSEIDAQIADKSLVNLEDGGTFTGGVIANANLSVGNATTTAGVLTLLEDDDDGANFASFMAPALAANTVYTLPTNDGDNLQVLHTDGSGVLSWGNDDSAGSTAYDDIGDPDAASSISFADGETVTWATAEDSAGSFFTIDDSDAALAANTYLLHLLYSVDDAEANADYFKCEDAGGVVFSIQQDGDTTIAGDLILASDIKGEPKHMVFNIINPLATQTEDNEICLWPAVPAALTVTKIQVTLDAVDNEVAGDLKWADAFIGLAGATVINVFDTSSGVLVDSSITAGSVASGKCMYIAFDSAPNTAIKQMCVDITYDFD